MTVPDVSTVESGTGVHALVLSTRNLHKIREMERLVAGTGVAIVPLPESVELPPEDGQTFSENALGKARAAAAATGREAIADDSGIEAAALGGAPGVRSARFAGSEATDEENLDKLRAEVPVGSGLRYVCALAFVDPFSGSERVFCGYCAGAMGAECRGTGGFGYDPIFVPHERTDGRTMAELSDEEKDEVSHRGKAVRAFLNWWVGS